MIYLYDGTKEGFLTALLQSYRDKNARLCSGETQLILGTETVNVVTDLSAAERARARLTFFDKRCMHDLELLLRSGAPDRDEVAYGYFCLLAEKKRPVRGMLTEDAARRADDCLKRIGLEIHRMHGFLRFMETQSGALYAAFSPDNDIAELLIAHFRARLTKFPFVINDVGRKKAAVWDGEHAFVAPLARAEVLLSAGEMQWQALWQRYYQSVNIPSRERLKQMRGYLPVRYMKFMPEFQNATD